MRLRLSNRLAVLAAVGVVAVSVGAARLPAATYAAQPRSLTADNFHEIAQQGFGDRQNSWAWSMAWFNNKLYVGTNRNYDCTSQAILNLTIPIVGNMIFPYPPKDPQILCPSSNGNPPTIQDLPPTISGEIWQMDPSKGSPITQTNWTKVYSAPYTVTISIKKTQNIPAPRNMGYRGMSVFTEADGTQALYASGVGIAPLAGKNNAPPPGLMRTTDGVNWQAVPADKGTVMGDLNVTTTIPGFLGTGGGCCMRGQASYIDKYGHSHFLVIIGGVQGAGAVFASTDPKDGDNNFAQITPSNMQVYEIASFGPHLYLGVQSQGGYAVMETDCMAPDNPGQAGCMPSEFKQIVPPGGGLGKKGNGGITSMHVYTDPQGVQHLYVGTNGARNNQPAELVRINADDTWDLVVGDPRKVDGTMKTPLSGFGSGFGWNFNYHMWRMNDYQGVLYVGTYDYSSNLWNTPEGPALQPNMGFDLWASPDGVTFVPVTQNGFGDMFSYGARSIVPTPDNGLFVGSANFWYGLRVWQGQVSQDAINLAPKGVQTDATDNQTPGAVALAWDPSSGATTHHVYRATLKRLHLAKPKQADPTRMDATSLKTFPKSTLISGPYAEIATSSSPFYVDRTAKFGKKYRYYVVAQDSAGNLSAQSNVASTPSLGTLPTFGLVNTVLSYLASHGKLSSAQTTAYSQMVQSAQSKLASGDAQGSHDQLATLRQQILSDAKTGGAVSRLYGEELAWMIGHLERRVTLVNAHVLSASRVN